MSENAITGPIDCACVIHGDAYAWTYVDRLYNMLSRNITPGIRLHVYTESDRYVPEPYIKHELLDFGVSGPKKSWWYKIQLFNTAHHQGPLLYFDLDTVIVSRLDWVWQHPLTYFWAVRDFKYLWKPSSCNINSSIMWWDTRKFEKVWTDFSQRNFDEITRRYRGDQDYIDAVLLENQCRFFDVNRVKSWRWQCLDGGYDFTRKIHRNPGSATQITHKDSILVFHGKPKPDQVQDAIIQAHWR